jgi:hypothetical protein
MKAKLSEGEFEMIIWQLIAKHLYDIHAVRID